MKTLVIAFAATLSVCTLAHAQGVPRYVVVPFGALTGDVPQKAGTKAAAMLQNELKNSEGIAVSEPHQKGAGMPWDQALGDAHQKIGEAQKLREKRKFRLAEEALESAVAKLRDGAAGLTDAGEIQDAYALLAAVQYNTGKDEDGAKNLRQALTLAPARELPLAQTSPLFAQEVQDQRQKLMLAPKGALTVSSTPQGAQVFIDGVSMGVTPIRVKDVPQGVHLWRVLLPSGEAAGGAIEVGPGREAKVEAQTRGEDPEGKIVSRLSQNHLDETVLAAAKQEAKETDADYVVFGALSRQGKSLALDAFLLHAQNGQVKRLPRAKFDTELLSAGMEFYGLAGKLAKNGANIGSETPVPGPVTLEPLPEGPRLAEVRYGEPPETTPAQDALPTGEGSQEEGPRVPLEPKKRAPLKPGH